MWRLPHTTMTQRKGTTRFGWCLDAMHDECWVGNNGQTCTCECHDQSEHWDGIPPLGGDDMDGR